MLRFTRVNVAAAYSVKCRKCSLPNSRVPFAALRAPVARSHHRPEDWPASDCVARKWPQSRPDHALHHPMEHRRTDQAFCVPQLRRGRAGIAILTLVLNGELSYEDTAGKRGEV